LNSDVSAKKCFDSIGPWSKNGKKGNYEEGLTPNLLLYFVGAYDA